MDEQLFQIDAKVLMWSGTFSFFFLENGAKKETKAYTRYWSSLLLRPSELPLKGLSTVSEALSAASEALSAASEAPKRPSLPSDNYPLRAPQPDHYQTNMIFIFDEMSGTEGSADHDSGHSYGQPETL